MVVYFWTFQHSFFAKLSRITLRFLLSFLLVYKHGNKRPSARVVCDGIWILSLGRGITILFLGILALGALPPVDKVCPGIRRIPSPREYLCYTLFYLAQDGAHPCVSSLAVTRIRAYGAHAHTKKTNRRSNPSPIVQSIGAHRLHRSSINMAEDLTGNLTVDSRLKLIKNMYLAQKCTQHFADIKQSACYTPFLGASRLAIFNTPNLKLTHR